MNYEGTQKGTNKRAHQVRAGTEWNVTLTIIQSLGSDLCLKCFDADEWGLAGEILADVGRHHSALRLV